MAAWPQAKQVRLRPQDPHTPPPPLSPGPLSTLLCNPSTPRVQLSTFPGGPALLGEENGNPLQYSRLENPTDRGAWRATVHGVTKVGHESATKPPPALLPALTTAAPLPAWVGTHCLASWGTQGVAVMVRGATHSWVSSTRGTWSSWQPHAPGCGRHEGRTGTHSLSPGSAGGLSSMSATPDRASPSSTAAASQLGGA